MTALTTRTFSSKPPLFTLDDALSADECAGLIQRAEGVGFTDAPITIGPNRFRMAPDIRNNTRVIVDDVGMAGWLWQRVKASIPGALEGKTASGLNERFRYYRYHPGQQFDWHRDGAFHRSDRESSLLTLIFYLNEGCEGGATEFLYVGDVTGHDEPLRIHPRLGAALAFAHPLLHRGAPVVEGVKYVLRTDVMYLS